MPPAYEVLLLNTAIPQIQAAQSGDTYVVPRDIAFNAGVTVGDASGDAFTINSSAVSTPNGLNFDSNTFVIDAANNRVGIGTNTPSEKLQVVGQALFGGAGTYQTVFVNNNSATGGGAFGVQQNGVTSGFYAISGGWLGDTSSDLAIAAIAPNIRFFTNNSPTERMRLDSSGNLGLGVAPSAWGSGWPALQVGSRTVVHSAPDGRASFGGNYYVDGTNARYIATAAATQLMQISGEFRFFTAPSGTAGNAISFTQAMTLDASGNLVVGGTSAQSLRITSFKEIAANNDATTGVGIVRFGTTYGSNLYHTYTTNAGSGNDGEAFGLIVGDGSAALTDKTKTKYLVAQNGTHIWYGSTTSSERARITSGGYFKASNNGAYTGSTAAYHESYNTASNYTHVFTNTNASPVGLLFLHSVDSNGTGNEFWYCQGNATQRAALRSNGGLANYQANNVNLSDQRTKKDIVAAPSYWDKIKGIEIVHFKYKDQTHDDNNVGVIAQQVEQVAPEFVDQDGWGETPKDGIPLKSIYTSDMYHAAIKALQEAMARIETLEAEVAALKGA